MEREPSDPIEALLPGYALNALDPDDRLRVERALEREPRYQEVLRDYLEGAAALARGFESVVPSASVRARPAPRDADTSGADLPSVAAATPAPRRAWALRTLSGVAAVLFVSIVGFGVTMSMQQGRIDDLETEMAETEQSVEDQRTLAYFSTLPNVETTVMKPVATPVSLASATTVGPRAMLMIDPDSNAALLVALNLDPLGPQQVYRTWLWDREGRATHLASFDVDASGFAQLYMHASDAMEAGRGISVGSATLNAGTVADDRTILVGRIDQAQ